MRWKRLALATWLTACSDDGDSMPPPVEPLEGIADLHLHMFAESAFGGGWFHGSHLGPGEVALGPCDGGEPGDHARLKDELAPLLGSCPGMSNEELAQLVPLVGAVTSGGGALVGELVGAVPGTEGDTAKHEDRTDGWPSLSSWPRWDAIAHQQVWEQHLREAHEGGLRLAVISTVSFDWLCRALPDENLDRPQCDEMDDVRLQLQQAADFDAANDWAEIARTPADARRIVAEGNLALVLSIEASHLMGTGDWRTQLDELDALGVRTLQLVHQLDNRFGGAAPHNQIFQLALYAETCHVDTDCGLTSNDVTLGFDVDASCKNVRGLTDEGRALAEEMFERGMLVDAAHLSEQSLRDLHELAVAHDHYPIYLSHGHFREVMLEEKEREEKTTPAWAVELVRETGGVFGLRTAHEEVDDYQGSSVANTCHGSSRSFAQAYDYGRLGLQVPLALGSDLNGFIQQTRPRFGPDACSASFSVEAVCQARDERTGGVAPRGHMLDESGVATVATLPVLLDDLDALGSDAALLRGSADAFVRMWERAQGPREGAVPAPTTPPSAAAIVPQPSQLERIADYPTECGDAYCPGGLVAGARCRFDAECESGSCADAGECGVPLGMCE